MWAPSMTAVPAEPQASPMRSGAPVARPASSTRLATRCRLSLSPADCGRTEALCAAGCPKDACLHQAVAAQPRLCRPVGRGIGSLQAPDLKEAFNIGLDLAADDPQVLAGLPFRGVNLWPDLAGFRDAMLAYFDAVWTLGRRLHRAFALDLGLPEAYFDDKLDRPMAILRLLHYPARPPATAAGQLGAGEHTDYGNLTLLATDAAGGLEVRARRRVGRCTVHRRARSCATSATA